MNKPKIGEYVLVTKWGDKDPYDPWYVGFVTHIILSRNGYSYRVKGSDRYWRNIFRITEEEGKDWIQLYQNGN